MKLLFGKLLSMEMINENELFLFLLERRKK